MSGVDETFDFVVVGSGGGSMCAALVMRAAGKSVLILEKTDLVGGTTARSGGVMWIPCNRFMRRDGVEDSYDNAMAYMEATAGTSLNAPGTSFEKRAAYVREGTRMVDFLVDQGVELSRAEKWPDYNDELPGASVPGRTVVAPMFDAAELGAWKDKLRPNAWLYPVTNAEGFEIALMKSSWRGKVAAMKMALRMTMARITGKHLVVFGGALQGRMLKAALGAGVEIRTDSPVTRFVIENDAVTGVVVEKDGKATRIGARRGVLVNAGGFAQNQQMRDRYIPGTKAEWTAVTPGDTGEMIQQMMGLGAATAQMNEFVGNQFSLPPGLENTSGDGVNLPAASGQMDISKPHSIIVDQSGVRYMNEAGSYMTFCQNMLKRNETVPAVPSWWIVDSQYMAKYMFNGTLAGTAKPQAWYDSGYLRRADSIEALAPMIGLDPATLKATVGRFNADARTGKDSEFGRGNREYDKWLGDYYHRPNPTLGPIEKGPFYAVPVVPGDVGTFGGVVTDVNNRVLKADGTPIPGLYATGVSTASVMGRFYPGAGSSIGPSFVGGWIAARHAAGLHNN